MSEPSNEAIMTAYVHLGGEPDEAPQLTVAVRRLAISFDAFAKERVRWALQAGSHEVGKYLKVD
jgi:hypothetical protein